MKLLGKNLIIMEPSDGPLAKIAFSLIESHHGKHNFLSSQHRAIQTVAARYTQVIILQNMAVSDLSLLHKLPLSPTTEYQEC